MKLRLKNGAFWCKDEAVFLRMKQIMSDPESWPDTYAEWLQRANEYLAVSARNGLVFTKIEADPEAFLAWCRIKAHRPDNKARAIYAGEEFGKLDNRNN